MESVSRTAGSSSTTNISPRERAFSAMFHLPCMVKRDAHSDIDTEHNTLSKRTRICTGRSLNAQVATHPLKSSLRSAAMQNPQSGGIAIEPEDRNDAYRSVVSDVISLIEHVQASLRLIEQEIARETASG